ncbi:MAG: ABC transporter ATP-binding protein [Chitinophagaceae bacterium]
MSGILNIDALEFGRSTSLCQAFSVNIDEAGLIILSGRNGSGKSTLLKTIAGLIPALSGTISINGYNLPSSHVQAPSIFGALKSYNNLSKQLAYVNTDRVKEDYIKVQDLILFGRFPYQQHTEKNLDILNEALQLLGIENIRFKYLNNISDGEWQKANIARALVQDTPIILMDEPSAFLDYHSKMQLFKDLRAISEQKNKLIIVSTHDMDLANRHGTAFWQIENHQFHFSDKPFQLSI